MAGQMKRALNFLLNFWTFPARRLRSSYAKAAGIRLLGSPAPRSNKFGIGSNFHKLPMPERKITPAKVAVEIRCILRLDGSAEHAKGVQWFFKEEVRSHGWYTADLRRLASHFRRTLGKEQGLEFLVRVADRLFTGRILEQKIVAVFLLEKSIALFEEQEFILFGAGSLPDRSPHDGETGAGRQSIRVGPVTGPLASPRGLRCAHSRHPSPTVLPEDTAALKHAAAGRRRHGPERPRMATARNCQSRRETDYSVSAHDSSARATAGLADRLRNAIAGGQN